MTVRTAQKGNADRVLRYVAGGWFFESGLFLWPTSYLSADDDQYFSGAGTNFLPEDTDNHIQGKYPSGIQNWANVTPKYEVNETVYLTEGHTEGLSGEPYNASMFTGLLRLAVQGKLALGTKAIKKGAVNELFPWVTIEPFQDGIVRAPDYTYFAVRVSDTGCKACLMEYDPIANDLVSRLIAGTFSADDAKKAEAVVLALLKPALDENDELIETALLSSAEVTPTEDPAISFLVAYGWHFSYPGLTECAIIRHGTEYFDVGECPSSPAYPGVQYTAYKSVISFTFSRASESDWESTTAYAVGDEAEPTTPNDLWYQCTTAGTSDVSEPTWPTTTGGAVVDGTAIWVCMGILSLEIGASISTDSVGTVWWNYPDTTTIWRPTIDHTKVESFWSRQCETDYVSAPIYCWYDDTGYRDVWINIKVFDDDELHIPPLASRRNCNTIYAQPTLSLTEMGGGAVIEFSLDAGISEASMEPSFDDDAGSWVTNVSPFNSSYKEFVSTAKVPDGEPDTDLGFTKKRWMGTCPAVYPSASSGDMSGQIVDWSEWVNYYAHYNQASELSSYIPFFCTALVIPRLNAEACAIFTRKSRERDDRIDYTDSDLTTNPSYRLVARMHYHQEYLGIDVDFNGGTAVGTSELIGSGTPWIISSGNLVKNHFALDVSTQDLTVEDERENTAMLVGASTSVDLMEETLDESTWNGYFNKDWNNGFDAIHFSTPASYGGSMKYPTEGHTPSDPKLLGDYTAEAEIIARISFESSPVYWIGWA